MNKAERRTSTLTSTPRSEPKNVIDYQNSTFQHTVRSYYYYIVPHIIAYQHTIYKRFQ